MNYYMAEVKHVLNNIEPGENVRFKVRGENAETKWLNLNRESISALKAFLNQYQMNQEKICLNCDYPFHCNECKEIMEA